MDAGIAVVIAACLSTLTAIVLSVIKIKAEVKRGSDVSSSEHAVNTGLIRVLFEEVLEFRKEVREDMGDVTERLEEHIQEDHHRTPALAKKR